jgi:uncharacterized protein YdaU (DUF1376 family)
VNKFFAECCAKNPRQKKNTRQIEGSSSVKKNTRQRDDLPECFISCTQQRTKIYFSRKEGEEKKVKKNFAKCPDLGHSAKDQKSFF